MCCRCVDLRCATRVGDIGHRDRGGRARVEIDGEADRIPRDGGATDQGRTARDRNSAIVSGRREEGVYRSTAQLDPCTERRGGGDGGASNRRVRQWRRCSVLGRIAILRWIGGVLCWVARIGGVLCWVARISGVCDLRRVARISGVCDLRRVGGILCRVGDILPRIRVATAAKQSVFGVEIEPADPVLWE